MIRQIIAVVVSLLLCLGSTLVTIESLSPRKFSSRRAKNNIFQVREHRLGCPPARSYRNMISSSRLFSLSDFSSHPYSVYYGTSGSTARQNFDQNDDINDVYGYGDDPAEGREEPYINHERRLRSMQDDTRLSGRRGATVFGRRYEGGNRGPAYSKDDFFPDDPPVEGDGNHFFDNDECIEDPHIMNELDGLLYERDNLRRNLDAVIRENIHLQNHQSINNIPESTNAVQGDGYQDSNAFIQDQNAPVGRDKSASGVVNEVMAELKNMQQTLLAVQTEQQRVNGNGRRDFIDPATTTNTDSPTIESVMMNAETMQRKLQTLGTGEDQDNVLATQNFGCEASMGEAVQPVEINGDEVNSLDVSQHQQFASEETISSSVGSIRPDDAARIISGEYVVVINAEFKRKSEMEGAIYQGGEEMEGAIYQGGEEMEGAVYQNGEEMDGGNDSAEGGTPPFCGETFGSRYL